MKDEHWSGLTARFKLDEVDKVPATVTLQASVSFWKEAAKNLTGQGFGAWQVRAAIQAVITKAEAEFYERISPEETEGSMGKVGFGQKSPGL